MAQLAGQGPAATASDTSIIDLTTAATKLGTVAKDASGNEYIYLTGVGSTVVGSAVLYTTSYTTALLPATGATCVGPVAVAMAAVNATTSFGWYQIYGFGSVKAGAPGGVGIRKQLFSATSASATGITSDTYQAGNEIHGMVSLSSSTAAPGDALVTVFLSRPHVNNQTDS